MKTSIKKKIILVKYQAQKQRHMARIQVALQTGLAAATIARIQAMPARIHPPGRINPWVGPDGQLQETGPCLDQLFNPAIVGHAIDLDPVTRHQLHQRLEVAQEIMEHATASVRILGSAQEWEGWAIGKLFIKIRGKHHRKPKNIFNTHFSLSHCHKLRKSRVKTLKISSYNL